LFYDRVFSALGQHGIRYAVAGGLAVNLHGVPRMTADIDLVVDLERNNLTNFLSTMAELGFQPRLPVKAEELLRTDRRTDWIENKNLHAFTFWNTSNAIEEVDLLIRESEDTDIIERAQVIQVGNLSIRIVSIDDLMSMKARANRVQDLADIEALQVIKTMEGK
jgi:hypothetical protein